MLGTCAAARDTAPPGIKGVPPEGKADDAGDIVVKSRAAHGPARIELFSLDKGEQIERIDKAFGDDLRDWAKPFSD